MYPIHRLGRTVALALLGSAALLAQETPPSIQYGPLVIHGRPQSYGLGAAAMLHVRSASSERRKLRLLGSTWGIVKADCPV